MSVYLHGAALVVLLGACSVDADGGAAHDETLRQIEAGEAIVDKLNRLNEAIGPEGDPCIRRLDKVHADALVQAMQESYALVDRAHVHIRAEEVPEANAALQQALENYRATLRAHACGRMILSRHDI